MQGVTNTYTHARKRMHTQIHPTTATHRLTQAYARSYIYADIRRYIRRSMWAHVGARRACKLYAYTNTHSLSYTQTHTDTRTLNTYADICRHIHRSMRAQACARRAWNSMHTQTHTAKVTHRHTWTYARSYTHADIRRLIRMHIYTHTHRHTSIASFHHASEKIMLFTVDCCLFPKAYYILFASAVTNVAKI